VEDVFIERMGTPDRLRQGSGGPPVALAEAEGAPYERKS
jgi:hypothetical protein